MTFSDPAGMEQRVCESIERELEISQHGVESRTFWKWLCHRLFRKLSKEYRARSIEFTENWEERHELEESLPEALRRALLNTEYNVPDVRWFQVMEKPRLLTLMIAATWLCEAFRLSNFTAADRHTLFWSHDHGTIARSFGYMCDDIREAGKSIPDAVQGFEFRGFALAELREVAAFIDMILVWED